jgi:hypothetical protein
MALNYKEVQALGKFNLELIDENLKKYGEGSPEYNHLMMRRGLIEKAIRLAYVEGNQRPLVALDSNMARVINDALAESRSEESVENLL